tara:strand:+ start:3291 stop:3689 length:399 start_codon:yes stop_codon:yes gene_type:complete
MFFKKNKNKYRWILHVFNEQNLHVFPPYIVKNVRFHPARNEVDYTLYVPNEVSLNDIYKHHCKTYRHEVEFLDENGNIIDTVTIHAKIKLCDVNLDYEKNGLLMIRVNSVRPPMDTILHDEDYFIPARERTI